MSLRGLVLVLYAIICCSCLDEIVLEGQQNTLPSIMIRGELALGTPSVVTVNISNLSSFDRYEKPAGIGGATIHLKSESGGIVELEEKDEGTYVLVVEASNPNIDLKENESYGIEVEIPSYGSYRSSYEILPEVRKIEDLRIDVVERSFLDNVGNIDTQAYVRIVLDADLGSSEKAYLKWDFECAYRFPEATIVTQPLRPFNNCYYFDRLNLDDVALFDGNQSANEQLSEHVVLEEPIDHRFYRGFYIHVFQQSISEGAHDYWRKVKELLNRDGSFFESPPGTITSNLQSMDRPEEVVFGYFYASAIDSLRLYIDQGDVGLPGPYCREVNDLEEFTSLDDECRYCLTKSGSTTIRPDFWVD